MYMYIYKPDIVMFMEIDTLNCFYLHMQIIEAIQCEWILETCQQFFMGKGTETWKQILAN